MMQPHTASADDSIKKILEEARKRHSWGEAISVIIGFSFTAVLIILLISAPIFLYSLFVVANLSNGLQDSTSEHAARQKSREEAKCAEAKKNGQECVSSANSNSVDLDQTGDNIGLVMVVLILSLIIGFFALLMFFSIVILGLSSFFLPALLALPLSLYLSWSWKNPYKILLLRPFSKKDTSYALKKFVRGGLSGFGFFYTLADSQIKQKWYVKYSLGSLSFFQFRFRKIRNKKAIDRMYLAMQRRRLRIFNWTVSRSKIFPLKCSDNIWQETIMALLYAADVVLIDLTGFQHNVQWEIETCKGLEMLDRVVFVADSAERSNITENFANLKISSGSDVVFYDENYKLGMQRVLFEIAQRISFSQRSNS